MSIESFPRVKSGRGVTLTPHPLPLPRSIQSRAKPLLPLRAVRPLQSLSACTVQLYLYSPQCLYSTAIPLLTLCAVRPAQSLSACTVQLYLYSPQCLYNSELFLIFYEIYICSTRSDLEGPRWHDGIAVGFLEVSGYSNWPFNCIITGFNFFLLYVDV